MRLLAVFLWVLVAAVCPFQGLRAQTAESFQTQINKLIEAGRLREAREQLNKVIGASGETPATMVLEARLLFKEQKFTESIRKLERLLAAPADPALKELDAEAHQLMGLNLVLLNRLDLAEPFLKDAAAMRPADPLAHFHLGMLYYTTSRFAAAETALRRAVGLNPEFARAHGTLGLALEELGEDEAALIAYRRAIELSEQQKLKDGSPYLDLGKFLLAKNRYQESLPLLEKAVARDGKSAEAAFQLGKALGKLGRDAEAVKALNQAISHNPDYAEPHYLLSRIYLHQGRKEEASKEMRIFEELQRKRANR